MSKESITRPVLKEELEKLEGRIDERFEEQEARLTTFVNTKFDEFEERMKHYMTILVEQVRDEAGGGRKDELGYVREKVNNHEERIEKLEGQRA